MGIYIISYGPLTIIFSVVRPCYLNKMMKVITFECKAPFEQYCF